MRIGQLLLLVVLVFSVSCKQTRTRQETSNHPAFQAPAIKTITEKIEKDPDNASLYFQRGNLLHGLDYDTLALDDFKKAATLDSNRAEYYSAVADLMFEHKDISGSLPWLERAVRLNPNDELAQLKIAKMQVFLKEYPKAFATINKVLRRNAVNPEGYFLKGLIYKDLKDTSKAISSFQTTIQIDPSYKEAILQLGLLYTGKNDPIALKYFENAYQVDTSDVFPLYAKGMYYQGREEYELAKTEFRKCVVRDPNYTKAIFGIGWILMNQDSLEKAWRQFDLVTRLEPVDAEAYYNRGLCSELMDKKPEALQDYRQALTFNPNYKEAADGIRRLEVK
jgi:tetratricopeptide (TPR) repeat protein